MHSEGLPSQSHSSEPPGPDQDVESELSETQDALAGALLNERAPKKPYEREMVLCCTENPEDRARTLATTRRATSHMLGARSYEPILVAGFNMPEHLKGVGVNKINDAGIMLDLEQLGKLYDVEIRLEIARSARDLPKVECHCRSILDFPRRHLGAEHPQTILALVNLAIVFRASKETSEAIHSFQEAFAFRGKPLGKENEKTLDVERAVRDFPAPGGTRAD